MPVLEASPDRVLGRPRQQAKPLIFVGLALLLIAMALAGFWPRYFGPLATSQLEPRLQFWPIHVHAALFMAWLLMLLTQATLVQRSRTRLHKRLGTAMAAYGFAIALFGLYVGLVLAARRVHFGGSVDSAAAFLFSPLTDMIMFAGFLAAAVHYRRRPDTHKRLMVLATLSFALVGLSRLIRSVPFLVDNRWAAAVLIVSPILIGIGHDLVTRRRVHPVWIIGLMLYLLRAYRRGFAESDAWLPIGRALLAPFI